MKSVSNITPFTLLDYPNKTACVLWYAGCNMRCLYCYNPEIALGKATIAFSETISFLESRIGLLDAVVFSGGECLVHRHIVEQIKSVKALGFLVKIDTNGSKPMVLEQLLQEQLIDYVSLDFKSPKEKVRAITKKDFYHEFIACLKILQTSKIPFEVRTTYHSDLLDTADIQTMMAVLEAHHYKGTFYIQHFRNGVETLGNLNHSVKNLNATSLATQNIKVVFR